MVCATAWLDSFLGSSASALAISKAASVKGTVFGSPFFDLDAGTVHVRFLAPISSGWIPATSPTRCPVNKQSRMIFATVFDLGRALGSPFHSFAISAGFRTSGPWRAGRRLPHAFERVKIQMTLGGPPSDHRAYVFENSRRFHLLAPCDDRGHDAVQIALVEIG